ncbi:TetR/AcrR family transcriptional regulator [Novosphingobium sp. Leaf2]|uniref:TetR/AcrR family transcriptional regulator n=1 Tax=Novosphingobium sp. Leaf2 TaxID=1735670 RepID=UPI0006F73163|nr:TetR/AcrR family transcriptional regulator [Novosphingobium sp. Leaf2]KQM21099.1 TetR family transcriptional regulator [Novosphingobium sp. Leaf2]
MQALKSAQTRARLIEATIRVLVRSGYSRTTTPQVALEAGLSRGAMLHHFDNGASLIKATIMHLHERRLRAFRRSAELSALDHRAMVRAYWRQIQKPAFVAFHELAVAARTDPDLAAVLLPLQVEFRERFNQLAVQLYPEWQESPAKFALAMAISQATMEGMAVNLLTGAMDAALVEPVLETLEAQLRALRPQSRDQAA